MVTSNGSTSDDLETAQLIALASKIGSPVTERTLEFWRHQGLLPHPERTGHRGKRPVWTYRPETADQLRALLDLRRHIRDPNVLRAALWYDGYQIETARVRISMSKYLQQLRDDFERELDKQKETGDDPAARWLAIQAVARVLAGRRTKELPRLNRQALSQRSSGIALSLGLLFGNEEAMRHLEADAPAVERLIGLDRGRRFRPSGVEPWLVAPPEEGLASFAQVGSIERLITVVIDATDQELQVARNLARTFLGGITAFSRIADAIEGRDNASGMAGIRVFENDPHASLIVVPLFLSILSSSELAQNLGQVIEALQKNVLPVELRARELAAMSEEERNGQLQNLTHLPFMEQIRIKRLLDEFSDKSE